MKIEYVKKQKLIERNEELRTTARMPEGEQNIKGIEFVNKHNGITMTIVSHWVSDAGIIIWTSDAGDLYSTRDIKTHWIMNGDE